MKKLLLLFFLCLSIYLPSQNSTLILGNNSTSPGITESYFIPGFICPQPSTYLLSVSPSSGVIVTQTSVNTFDVTFPSCGVYVISGLRPCQNFVTGYLTVNVSGYINTTNNISICQGDSVLINGIWNSTAGIYIDTINTLHCDTIITTNLNILPNNYDTINASICLGGSYTLPGGNIVSASGTYYDTISTIAGCDSIYIINLSVNSFITSSQNPVICTGNSFTLPDGSTATTTGIYLDTLLSINGCDSIITTNLIVNPIYNNNINASVCAGNSYVLPGGNSVSSAGIYNDTLLTISGCDSVINTNLSVVNAINITTNASICSGQTYTLPGGNSVSISGTYIDTLTAAGGCDSIITTNLNLINTITTNQTVSICNGNTYTLPGGTNVNTAGIYNDTINSSTGCDSIIITNLTILQNTTGLINVTVCDKEGYTFSNGTSVYNSGIFNDTLIAKNGCDSILIVNLSVNPSPISNITPGPVININYGTNTTLTATGFGTYNWYPSTGLNTTQGNTVIANPTQTTIYCVEVTSPNGCKDTSCVTITVDYVCPSDENLKVPNAFSPNGDALNDGFCLLGWNNSCIKDFEIIIFNRWGEKIFNSENPEFCWNGIYNGAISDAQVFVYYIRAINITTNNKIVRRGNITLIK